MMATREYRHPFDALPPPEVLRDRLEDIESEARVIRGVLRLMEAPAVEGEVGELAPARATG